LNLLNDFHRISSKIDCFFYTRCDKDSIIIDIDIHDYKQLGYNNKMTKEEKLRTFASLPSHAMVIVGYHSDVDNMVKRWKIENSWGTARIKKAKLFLFATTALKNKTLFYFLTVKILVLMDFY